MCSNVGISRRPFRRLSHVENRISRTTRYLSSDNFPDVLTIQALSKASFREEVDIRQLKAPDDGKQPDGLVDVGMEEAGAVR
jgi:hypothetical protein